LNSFLVPHRSRQATQPWRSVGAHLLSSPYVSSHVRLFATKSSSDDDEASYLDGTGFFSEPLLDENDASYLDATESSQTLMRYCLGDGKLPHKHTTTGTRETGGNDGEGKLSIKGTSPFLSPKCSSLTHLNASGDAHMVSISSKVSTSRQAVAVCSVYFSNPTALPLIRSNSMKKGDVLSVARVAGIMAAKRTSDLIPLCHPIAITHVSVDLQVVGGSKYDGDNQRSVQDHDKNGDYCRVEISATVTCDGKTGVEMEALTAASTAALTMYDMCKAVDKGMRIMDLRVIRKEGGKSGTWIEGGNVP
jgi:molybdenum cofactor biosynthesis protein MoaC